MMRGMAVLGLYALQNGFMGFERSGLFYDEFSGDRVRIPIACWLVRTSDSMILFDTGLSPRAVPGLLRNDPLARFTEEDLLVHRLELVGLEPDNVDMVVLSHLHYQHAVGAFTVRTRSSGKPSKRRRTLTVEAVSGSASRRTSRGWGPAVRGELMNRRVP